MIWIQPAVASLDKTLYDDYLLLGGFEEAANSVDKNLKKSTETLDNRKLLSRCGFLQSRSSCCNEKCADRPIKVNIRSIRFSYVFVRFFTFLLLLEKVCAFSSAFL